MPTEPAGCGPGLTIGDFDYDLPPDLIAQDPAEKRSGSRLLALSRADGTVRHLGFSDLPSLLRAGDVVVVNDTKVFPARLMARRSSGGSVEILLLSYPTGGGPVPCLLRPSRKIRGGEALTLEEGTTVTVSRNDRGWTVGAPDGTLATAVGRVGRVPLPPYIRRTGTRHDARDRARYQTVFARETGAVAAPTAGLHFDEPVLEAVRSRGARVVSVTLHVGPGTFAPVRTQDPSRHRMEKEAYEVPEAAAAAVREARQRGGRVVAVGTTVVRTLESAWDEGLLRTGKGETGLFILPGHRFRVVDALVTNFHLPRSTLLMLVCAFAGVRPVLSAYAEAVEKRYRFYSYGDAMFIG